MKAALLIGHARRRVAEQKWLGPAEYCGGFRR
jgi:hypothetical protein